MDTIIYYNGDDPVMLMSDSKASIVMSIDNAEISVMPEMVDGKTVLRFINEDGFTVALNMTEKGARELGRQMLNLVLVRKGRSPLDDVDAFIEDQIDKHNRGES